MYRIPPTVAGFLFQGSPGLAWGNLPIQSAGLAMNAMGQVAAAVSAKVLVVDDDEKTRDMLSGFLASDGHHCIATASGAEAVALCGSTHFDCMLLDVGLEGMSGLAVAQRLGGSDSVIRPHCVFLISGRPKSDFADAIRQGWADGHLLKPIAADELAAAVRNSLRTNPATP